MTLVTVHPEVPQELEEDDEYELPLHPGPDLLALHCANVQFAADTGIIQVITRTAVANKAVMIFFITNTPFL